MEEGVKEEGGDLQVNYSISIKFLDLNDSICNILACVCLYFTEKSQFTESEQEQFGHLS